MELGGLITPHCKDQLLNLTQHNITLLAEASQAFEKDIAAFRSGETLENPVEGRRGTHSYDNRNYRLSASYYGPSTGSASLEIRSNSVHFSITIPAAWNIDDTLTGIVSSTMQTLCAIRDFLSQENLPTTARGSVIIGQDPLFWLITMSTLSPKHKLEDFTLKTVSTPSKIDGVDDESAMEAFDQHCPAFCRIEINKNMDGDLWIKIIPVHGYDIIFDGAADPVSRMRIIAKASELGIIPRTGT